MNAGSTVGSFGQREDRVKLPQARAGSCSAHGRAGAISAGIGRAAISRRPYSGSKPVNPLTSGMIPSRPQMACGPIRDSARTKEPPTIRSPRPTVDWFRSIPAPSFLPQLLQGGCPRDHVEVALAVVDKTVTPRKHRLPGLASLEALFAWQGRDVFLDARGRKFLMDRAACTHHELSMEGGPHMQRFEGIAGSDGIAYGPARLLAPRLVVPERWITPAEVGAELDRLERGLDATDQQLLAISHQLRAEVDGTALVQAHRLILRSDEIVQQARELVSVGRMAAETAVRRAVDKVVHRFEDMDSIYFRERGDDVAAVGERVVRTIVGAPAPPWEPDTVPDGIGIGVALSPLDAFRLREAQVSGLATEGGGKTSHLAIVLRALEIPYVAGVPHLVRSLRPQSTVIIDGSRGIVIVDPDSATLAVFEQRRRQLTVSAHSLQVKGQRPATTSDGVRVEIGANIDRLEEVGRAVSSGAESVGLVRTELLYLDRRDLPSEDEQYRDAVGILKALAGRTATFRTLDLGGEKLPLAVPMRGGANPSLGVRAIRLSTRHPDIFRTQLRALYRASAAGPLRILFPMISGVAEMLEARRMATQVRAELADEGVPHQSLTLLGAMIETPSAAVTADHLAEVSDFFSIGTNDLVQYAFAADRENPEVQYLHDPLHPAVLRMLKLSIEAAMVAGRPISLCGDMAGDPTFTWVLLGLGLRELSMVPAEIAAVRSVIVGTSLAEAQALTAEALRLRTGADVQELVGAVMRRRFPAEIGAAA